MQTWSPWFEYMVVAFAAVYVVLTVIRIALQWKHMKTIAAAGAVQKERAENFTAVKTKNDDNASRLQAIQQNQLEQQKRSEELFHRSKETQDRWSSILSRLEALADKIERQSGA